MPRFSVFQPFKASYRSRDEQAARDDRLSRYGTYEQSRTPVATTRSGSRWRNVLTKRREPRDDSYIDDPGYGVTSEPEVRRMPVSHPSRRATVEDYDSQESMTTDSNDYPARYPRLEREPGTRFVERMVSHESLPREPSDHYVQRVPSHESIPVEGHTPQPTVIQTPSEVPPLVSPPEVYMEEPVPLLAHDERSAHEHEPPVIQAEPRRFRARRGGEPITVGNMRIEVEDDGRHSRSHRSPRRHGSTSTSTSSQSYSSSSYDERPIIIAADPHTHIEIGNEEDGFVPYEQYLADREARRRRRRRHHRDTPEEEIYVIPAGTNVIFVDEDGRELHRVGEFDDRYSNRRRNTSARTTRQILPSYQEAKERIAGHTYTEKGVQTESNEIRVRQRPSDVEFSSAPNDSQLISQMHERMRNFMNSRPPSRCASPLRREVGLTEGLTERSQSASLIHRHDQSFPLPFPDILQCKAGYNETRRMNM